MRSRMRIGWGHLSLAWGVVLMSVVVSTAPAGPAQVVLPPLALDAAGGQAAPAVLEANPELPSKTFVSTYCTTCHNQRLKTAGLLLDTMDVSDVAAHAPEWEKVVIKLRAGLMPPSGMPRPDRSVIDS